MWLRSAACGLAASLVFSGAAAAEDGPDSSLAHARTASFLLEQARRGAKEAELIRFARRFAKAPMYCTIELLDQRDRYELEIVHYNALPMTCRGRGRRRRSDCSDGEFRTHFLRSELAKWDLEVGHGSLDAGLYHRGGQSAFPVDCGEALRTLTSKR